MQASRVPIRHSTTIERSRLEGAAHYAEVFFAKGLWDRAETLEGTIAAYDHVNGLKEIVVVRGPHSMEAWPPQEVARTRQRMTLFAVAAVQGSKTLPDAPAWSNIRELVATTPDVWETSSAPR